MFEEKNTQSPQATNNPAFELFERLSSQYSEIEITEIITKLRSIAIDNFKSKEKGLIETAKMIADCASKI